MLETFSSIVPLFLQYGYWFMIGGSFIEGFNMMILAGFLSSTGYFNLWFSLIAVAAGHTLSGYAWYAVGYWSGAPAMEKWGHRIRLTEEKQRRMKEYFARYSGRTILITKFTFALTIATMIFAGSMRMDFRRFSLWNITGSFGWSIITIAIGYLFGESYKVAREYITNIGIGIAFVVGAGVVLFFIRQAVKTAFVRNKVDRFWVKIDELRAVLAVGGKTERLEDIFPREPGLFREKESDKE